MMSFINESNIHYNVQLASAQQMDDALTEEAIVNKLVDKSGIYTKAQTS